MAEAITAGGGQLVPLAEAEALVWGAPSDPEGLRHALHDVPGLEWVQLPFAGIETFVDLVDDERVWTCGKGVYAEPVAEMALTLALAGMRHLGSYVRATEWQEPHGRNLIGANVTILGGGGITEHLLRLLAPFDCHVTVVRNRVADMEGADLQWANLQRADLSGAKVRAADLRGAKIWQTSPPLRESSRLQSSWTPGTSRRVISVR